jgi:hypothetical protein
MYFFRRESILMEHPLLVSLIAFAIGGFSIHNAMRYTAVAAGERTAEASVTRARSSMHTRSHSTYSLSSLSMEYHCSYNFSVDGESYSNSGYISELSVDDSIKAELQEYTDVPFRFNATVYYDPANPSRNSLTEYGAMSEDSYRFAELSIGVGVVFVIFVALGAVLTANSKTGNRGIIVDAQGTVIHPNKVDPGRQDSANDPTKIGSRDKQPDRSASPIIRRK